MVLANLRSGAEHYCSGVDDVLSGHHKVLLQSRLMVKFGVWTTHGSYYVQEELNTVVLEDGALQLLSATCDE